MMNRINDEELRDTVLISQFDLNDVFEEFDCTLDPMWACTPTPAPAVRAAIPALVFSEEQNTMSFAVALCALASFALVFVVAKLT